MQAELIMLLALACPQTRIENWTNEWNKQDQWTLDNAKKRCGQLYPDAPCVKMFRKKDESTYNVICSGNK